MITYQLIDNVGKITLNRPNRYHAFIREMSLEFQDALDECNEDENVRCILITAEGKAFCAGQDLSEFPKANKIDFNKIITEHYNPIIHKVRNIEKPVIAAINGVAAGAGASIAICCDIIVAAKSASFVQAFSKIGLIPDSGGTFFLPRLIGMQKATGLMMTGDTISASEALKIGMIYKVFEDKVFEEESWKIAKKLSKMPTKALGITKRLLNNSYINNLNDQLDLEKECQVEAGNTKDFIEGVEAFLEKRMPKFKGN